MSKLWPLLGIALGGLIGVEPTLAQNVRYSEVGYNSGYRPIQSSRTIARPLRGARYVAPPRGAYLVRGRYWNPNLRWKTDRYTRSLYAVHRGEVWFLDPSSGWAYTIDRYGRVYTCDPRYRAVYSLGPVAAWRGEIPYFFGYFAPDDGYYALPRYRNFVSYYQSPRYDYFDYDDAYDYWWDTYDDHFYSRRFNPTITFSFFDVRSVRYDRYYVRDVYIDRRGQQYLEPAPPRGRTSSESGTGIPGGSFTRDSRQRNQPGTINGVPTGAFLGRSEDARLPELSSVPGFAAPAPDVATEVMERLPAVPEVQIAPAVAVNVAEVVAVNPQVNSAVPTPTQMATIEQSMPATVEQPVSSFDTVQTFDTESTPEALPTPVIDPEFNPSLGLQTDLPDAEASVVEPRPTTDPGLDSQAQIPERTDTTPLTLEAELPTAGAEVREIEPELQPDASESGRTDAVNDSSLEPEIVAPQPSFSEPEPSFSEPEPSFSEPEPSFSEPEPSFSEPEPSFSEPEPSFSEPEPSFSEPEPSFSEPEPSFSEPEPSFSEPEPSFSEPEPPSSEPEPSYSEPEPSYSEPEPSYSEPEPSYSEPEPSYSEPEPSYSEPEPSIPPDRAA